MCKYLDGCCLFTGNPPGDAIHHLIHQSYGVSCQWGAPYLFMCESCHFELSCLVCVRKNCYLTCLCKGELLFCLVYIKESCYFVLFVWRNFAILFCLCVGELLSCLGEEELVLSYLLNSCVVCQGELVSSCLGCLEGIAFSILVEGRMYHQSYLVLQEVVFINQVYSYSLNNLPIMVSYFMLCEGKLILFPMKVKLF